MTLTQTKSSTALFGFSVYAFSQLFLFGMSAIYHRPNWSPKPRAILKRIDHCAIFISIAGTFTPICLLGLEEASRDRLLSEVWGATLLGFLISIFWVKAPKWVTGLLYVIVGWLCFPFLPELARSLGHSNITLMLSGGIAYTIGAVIYALKKPNLVKDVFGYHELFHLLTVVGAVLMFIPVYRTVAL